MPELEAVDALEVLFSILRLDRLILTPRRRCRGLCRPLVSLQVAFTRSSQGLLLLRSYHGFFKAFLGFCQRKCCEISYVRCEFGKVD